MRSLRLILSVTTLAVAATGAYGADECASTEDACLKDEACTECLNNTDAAPVNCATTATTCEGWWDMACCTYGSGSDACVANALLLEHLQCLAAGNDCTIDGVCPEGSSSNGNAGIDLQVTDDAGCIPQITACIYDTECLGCLNDAVPAGCEVAAETAAAATSICDAVSEMMCCLYGDNTACHSNTVLSDYTECAAAQSGCTIDSLCPPGQDGQDGAEGVGAVDVSEGGDNDLAVEAARSSGNNAVTRAAALALVLPIIMFLSGVAVFL